MARRLDQSPQEADPARNPISPNYAAYEIWCWRHALPAEQHHVYIVQGHARPVDSAPAAPVAQRCAAGEAERCWTADTVEHFELQVADWGAAQLSRTTPIAVGEPSPTLSLRASTGQFVRYWLLSVSVSPAGPWPL
jgi:hypothetical protein